MARIDGQSVQVVTVSDISNAIMCEKLTLKDNFSQKLAASLCHEVMSPLNSILNVSEILLVQQILDQPGLTKP